METTIIRKATIKDLYDIQRLNLDLFKKEYKEFDKSLNLDWTNSKDGKQYFSYRIKNKKNSFVEVVECDGKIIGYLCGGLQQRAAYRKNGIYAEAENMLIDKNYRGKGLGGKLMQNFLKWCKAQKVKYVSVKASYMNKSGIDFYQKNGFKNYDIVLERKLS